MHKRHPNTITFILLAPVAVFVGLFVIGSSVFKSGKYEQSFSCVMPPDPTNTITLQGEQYDQILPPVAFSAEEFGDSQNPTVDWHFKKITTVNNRDVWRVLRVCEGWGALRGIKCDTDEGKVPAPINWNNDPNALDLAFVDYSKEVNSSDKNIRYMATYLKEGTPVPSFIKSYCAKSLPYKPLDYTAAMAQNDGVPYTVDPASIAYTASSGFRFDAGTYTLFMYEDASGPSGHFAVPKLGTMNIDKPDGTTKRYSVYVSSFAKFLELLSPGDKFAYLYSKNVTPINLFPPTDFAHKNLQLETFYPVSIGSWGWWEPECKPAIYLYPQQETNVHVTVDPAGFMTYTDPIYPKDGWQVTARPDGSIVSGNKTYPYLYYESKIRDTALTKPTKGFVVTPQELPALFTEILPRLGLSAKETSDFKNYWENKLPEAKYYFVGVMENKAIDAIEPLTISPKADTIIRVRLYFEALDSKRSVQAPTLTSPGRRGFVVSEWGGLVKADKNHPFTCSQ